MKKKNPIAKAFAPATVANVAVGFDILGFALSGLGEIAIVEKIPQGNSVILDPVEGYPQIPTEAAKNTATAGLLRLIADRKLDFGFHVTLQKQIPVGSGLGGSSTSAVATIVAANALLKKKLSAQELLHYALIGEEVASGSKHGDNIGPCLMGGLNFVRSQPEISTEKIKTPTSMHCVVILPATTINTKYARQILKTEVLLKSMVEQTANLTGFILGCLSSNFNLIRQSLKDQVIEPQRATLIPGFYDFQSSALTAGALGCSISGSGPALFALTKDQKTAKKVLQSLLNTAEKKNIRILGSWISPIAKKGAHVLTVKR